MVNEPIPKVMPQAPVVQTLYSAIRQAPVVQALDRNYVLGLDGAIRGAGRGKERGRGVELTSLFQAFFGKHIFFEIGKGHC